MKEVLTVHADKPTIQLRNRLLSALLNQDYQRLVSHLRQVELKLGEVIYTAGDTIENVYFPETSVVSLLSTLENGDTTEVGLIGNEGMVGLSVFLGGSITPERALVQLGGTALKNAGLRFNWGTEIRQHYSTGITKIHPIISRARNSISDL